MPIMSLTVTATATGDLSCQRTLPQAADQLLKTVDGQKIHGSGLATYMQACIEDPLVPLLSDLL
jgi:hypothetical protein